MDHERIWDGDLNLVFTELYKNELDVKAFIVKLQEILRMYIIAILWKNQRVTIIETSMGEESVNGAIDGNLSGDDTI